MLKIARIFFFTSFFFCVRCNDRAKSSGRWLPGSPPSAEVRQLVPRAWCLLQCLLAKTVGVLTQVWRMCSGVCLSEQHSQWAESARPNLFIWFLSLQWPVRRRKMVIWVLLSRVLIWSFCGSYPLFFSLRADFCFCFRKVLTSLYEVERWGWGSFAAAFASLSAV